jgi:hypothetical protein
MNILDPIFYRTLFYDFSQWSPRGDFISSWSEEPQLILVAIIFGYDYFAVIFGTVYGYYTNYITIQIRKGYPYKLLCIMYKV